ncbi:MAG: DNA-processing protein DprA, partial [Actinobacteria bacterium]|nr:DNA-processing protein DprA [Actinomycetota bacterium]
RFPPRNRIISGLARAVVVVEAAVKGGALITAGIAAEQGREVLAVPGDVGREASEGCNLLIRDGAVPVLGPDDLVEALSLVLGPPQAREAADGPGGHDAAVLAALGPAGSTLEAVIGATGLGADRVLEAVARLEAGGAVARVGARLVPQARR